MDKIVKNILDANEWLILREWDDIDVYFPPAYIDTALDDFSKAGFCIQKTLRNSYEVFKFSDDNIFVNIDVINSSEYLDFYFWVYPEIDFFRYSKDLEYKLKIDIIRYILLLRSDEKSCKLLNSHFKNISPIFMEFFMDKNYIFSSFPKDFNHFYNFLNRSIFSMFRMLKLRFFTKYCIARIYEIFYYLWKWKVVCLIWPDWAWKTTLAQTLAHIYWWRWNYVYFWNKWWILDTLQHSMKWSSFYYKIYANIYIYCIFWLKYFQIQKDVFFWKTVFVDRWPTYEYWVLSYENPLVTPFYFLYKYAYPLPTKTFLIFVEPSTIKNRKNELTVKKIQGIYDIFGKIVRNSIKVDNNKEIWNALNYILSKIVWKELR